MMIHLVHGQALFDVRREIASRTLERTGSTVILHVTIQIPFVRRSKIAHDAFDHRHRMVFHVFAEARLDVRHIAAFLAPEEFRFVVFVAFVLDQLGSVKCLELTNGAFEQFVIRYFWTGTALRVSIRNIDGHWNRCV